MTILFVAKYKPFAHEAAELIKLHTSETAIFFGDINDPFPPQLLNSHFDYVISYISPWIIPKQTLNNVKTAAINFHPGPPEYPGIGCTNFAIYNGAKEFGITVHHMEKKVDTGDIIAVKRFPIFERDTVYSLTQRCYAYLYASFIDLLPLILSGSALPKSGDRWKRKPYSRQQLNELCVVTKDMSEDEVKRRVRATAFPNMPGAFIELGGIRFLAEDQNIGKRGGK